MTYTPKNILVTGGCGFIGSHFLNSMTTKYPDYMFYNMDSMTYCASQRRVENISDYSNYHFIKGDICSVDLVNYIMLEKRIDTVVHFAAESHVDSSFGNSLAFTRSNVQGTHTLLECAKQNHIKRFIHISTDELYGRGCDIAASEDSPIEPTNPYSASKAAAEMLVKSYMTSFNLPIIVTRSNNICGPNQYPEKIIPKFISQILKGMKMTIHGDGSNQRSFLHVRDVCRAFDIILHNGCVNSVYNIGSDNELKNIDLAKKIAGIIGVCYSDYIEYVEDRPFNDHRYHITSEAIKALGWKEEVDFEEGLIEIVNWVKDNKDFFKTDSITDPHPSKTGIY